MKTKLIAALTFVITLTLSGLAQTTSPAVFPAMAVNSPATQLPKEVKVIARVPLASMPVTRMYTQWEYGRTYLYIEHGGRSLTTVDVSKKRNPRPVDHQPAKVEAPRYVELSEGGTIEIWPQHVTAGIDTIGGTGTLSVLEDSNPKDAKLLQALGRGSNLVDRDSGLVYFASPSQLLIVQDNRWTRVDYMN